MRTTKDPRVNRVTVRLTGSEEQALEMVRRQGGYRYLADALRSLIPKLQLVATPPPKLTRTTTRTTKARSR